MIRAIVENEKQMVITSGLVAFVIDNCNTAMFVSSETDRAKLYARRGEIAWRNASNRKYEESDMRQKAYNLSRKEKAAIIGFYRTENIEIDLPNESGWQGITNFFGGRKDKQGEVLNIVNQCKTYAKSVIHSLSDGYDTLCAEILDCFSLEEGKISHYGGTIKEEVFTIDSEGILKNMGVSWEELDESEGDEYYSGSNPDHLQTKYHVIKEIAFTKGKHKVIVEVTYNDIEITNIEIH